MLHARFRLSLPGGLALVVVTLAALCWTGSLAAQEGAAPAWAKEPPAAQPAPAAQPTKAQEPPQEQKTPAPPPEEKKPQPPPKQELKKFGEEPKKEEPKKKEESPAEKRSSALPEGKEQPKKEKEKKPAAKDWRTGTIYQDRPSISPASVVPSYNHLGLMLAPVIIKDYAYAGITPNMDFHWWEDGLSSGFWVPLNFEIVDASQPIDPRQGQEQITENMFRLRPQDWDEARDFAKIIRYIKYGNKADKLYFNIGNLSSYTIGHGTVVRRYVNTADFDHRKVGLQFDMAFQKDEAHDWGGFEMFLSDITFGSQLFGVLAYFKPLFFMESEYARSLSVGLHGTFDLNAPFKVDRDPDDWDRPVINQDSNEIEAQRAAVSIFGLDGVVKVLRTPHVDVKPYFDLSFLTSPAADVAGSGFALGVLNRFKLGEDIISRLALRLEGRLLNGQYLPAYFNTYYEIQKYQFFTGPNTLYTNAPTKLGFLAQELGNAGSRFGYYLDLTYEAGQVFAAGTGYENSSGPEGGDFMIHLSITPGKVVSAHATYHKVNIGGAVHDPSVTQSSFFEFDTDDHLLLSALRVKVLPVMYIKGWYSRMWLMENRGYDDRKGLYRTINMAGIGLEFGYDWDPFEEKK